MNFTTIWALGLTDMLVDLWTVANGFILPIGAVVLFGMSRRAINLVKSFG